MAPLHGRIVDQIVKNPQSLVEGDHVVFWQQERRPVVVVERDLHELTFVIVAEHGPGCHQVSAVSDVLTGHGNRGKGGEIRGHLGLHMPSDCERVDHRRLGTRSLELEAVQQLRTGGIVRVRAVGMRTQLQVGVGRIGLGEISGELPHAAKDRLAHVTDAAQQSFGGLGGGRRSNSQTETKFRSLREPFANAAFGVNHRRVCHRRYLGADERRVPQRNAGVRRQLRSARSAISEEERNGKHRVGAAVVPGDIYSAVLDRSGRCGEIWRQRSREQLALLRDGVHGAIVVSVIAQPDPRVSRHGVVIPTHLQRFSVEVQRRDGDHGDGVIEAWDAADGKFDL